MKKLLLVLSLFLMVGCKGSLTLPSFELPDIFIKGLTGISTRMLVADHSITTIEGAQVGKVMYSVVDNTGGAGSVAIGITSYGGDCASVTPALTIPILANTNIGQTEAAALLALQNTYYAVGQHRACLTYTQTDVNVPLNFTFRTAVDIAINYEIKTGF